MIMQPLKKRATDLSKQIEDACERLHIEAQARELAVVDEQLADSGVWNDASRATTLSRRSAGRCRRGSRRASEAGLLGCMAS